MRHAKALIGTALLVTTAIACASIQSSDALSREASPKPTTTGDGASSSSSGGASAGPAFGSPAATGVVIAHSATFPSFRLCFQNFPDALPQPDSKVMPAANVVGVEVGGAVRIDALPEAPGMVYVIDETQIRVESGADDARTCGELISEIAVGAPPANALDIFKDYYPASEITRPLGVGEVDVLALTGCADAVTIRSLDQLTSTPAAGSPAVASCGTTWNASEGNLTASAFQLTPNNQGPTDTEIPVSVFNLSAAATAIGASIEVRFGSQVDAGPLVSLPINPKPFEPPADDARIAVDQTKEASYGQLGFEVASTVGGTRTARRQSLADVQQLSAPGDVPTTYYRSASNYALLVLGDPSHSEEKPGGGANLAFNPRRALHIVAVPVLDPTKLGDAGADAGSSLETDAGIK